MFGLGFRVLDGFGPFFLWGLGVLGKGPLFEANPKTPSRQIVPSLGSKVDKRYPRFGLFGVLVLNPYKP